MVLSRWSTRAAANRSACPAGLKSAAKPVRIASRNASAPGEPPGSRVRMTARPSAARRSSSRLAWTDLPAPSPPSSVTNRPLFCMVIVRASDRRSSLPRFHSDRAERNPSQFFAQASRRRLFSAWFGANWQRGSSDAPITEGGTFRPDRLAAIEPERSTRHAARGPKMAAEGLLPAANDEKGVFPAALPLGIYGPWEQRGATRTVLVMIRSLSRRSARFDTPLRCMMRRASIGSSEL